MRWRVFGVELQRQPADGAAVLAVRAEQTLAVRVEQGEDALDGRGVLVEHRLDDLRVEQVFVGLEHRSQHGVFALEEVIEAAAVGAGPLEQFREACGGVALLPEQVPGGLDDALAGVALLHT